MQNYWVVRVGEGNRLAEDAYKNNLVTIGWEKIGDLSRFKTLNQRAFIDQVSPLMSDAYPAGNQAALSIRSGQLFRFLSLIKVGDIVVIPKTQDGIVYIGQIESDYYYEKTDDSLAEFPNRRKIKWLKVVDLVSISQSLKNSIGGIMTVFGISHHSQEINGLINIKSTLDGDVVENIDDFGMESHLEDFIVKNWSNLILGKKYKIVSEDDKLTGQQYNTPIGRIDILAKSKDDSEWLVIELKKGRNGDQVVGQILRYIGWIRANEAGSTQKVSGLIITQEFDDKLHYAVSATNNIKMMTYKVKFTLEEE